MQRRGFDSSSGRNNTPREGVVPGGNNPQGDGRQSPPPFHPYQAATRVDALSGQRHYEEPYSTHPSQISGPYSEIRPQPPNTDARPHTAASASVSKLMTNVSDTPSSGYGQGYGQSTFDRPHEPYSPYQAATRVDALSGQRYYEEPYSAHPSQISGPYSEIRPQPQNTDTRPHTTASASVSKLMTNVSDTPSSGYGQDYDQSTFDRPHESHSPYQPPLDRMQGASYEQLIAAQRPGVSPARAYEQLNAQLQLQISQRRIRNYQKDWVDRHLQQMLEAERELSGSRQAQSDQQLKEVKEAVLGMIDPNLAARFRNNESNARNQRRTNIYEEARILDDYVGRAASSQGQTYSVDQAFGALKSIATFLDNPSVRKGSSRTAFKQHLETLHRLYPGLGIRSQG